MFNYRELIERPATWTVEEAGYMLGIAVFLLDYGLDLTETDDDRARLFGLHMTFMIAITAVLAKSPEVWTYPQILPSLRDFSKLIAFRTAAAHVRKGLVN